MKLVTTKFKLGGLHEKHVVATWNVGNHFSICFYAQGNQEKPVSRWPVAGPSQYWLLASSPARTVRTAILQHKVRRVSLIVRHVYLEYIPCALCASCSRYEGRPVFSWTGPLASKLNIWCFFGRVPKIAKKKKNQLFLSSCTSVRPSVSMQQLVSHWRDFPKVNIVTKMLLIL